jgi:hypothetical protein
MGWYKKLPVPRSKAARLRDVLRYDSPRRPPTIRAEKLVFFKAYSKAVYLHGYRAKVCSRYHIAKFFGVPLSTIHSWHKAGALPEPFMQLYRESKPYPVFLSAQLRVLLVVVRDLVDAGYVSIPWRNLPDHLDMLHEGYAVALKNFNARYSPDEEREAADRFGVIMHD